MHFFKLSHHLLAAWALWLGLATAAAAFEKPEDLPEGEAREEVFYLCSACHSFELVGRQGMSRALWDDTLTFMVSRHGMPEPTPDERDRMLDYLAAAFPPPEKRGWQNPFLTK